MKDGTPVTIEGDEVSRERGMRSDNESDLEVG